MKDLTQKTSKRISDFETQVLQQFKDALRKFDFKSYEETLAKTQKDFEDTFAEQMTLRERMTNLEAESKVNFR